MLEHMVTPVCDGCGYFADWGEHSAHDTRLEMKSRGWRSPRGSGLDYCPRCVKKRVWRKQGN